MIYNNLLPHPLPCLNISLTSLSHHLLLVNFVILLQKFRHTSFLESFFGDILCPEFSSFKCSQGSSLISFLFFFLKSLHPTPHFRKKQCGGVSHLPKILFHSVRCLLYKCLDLPVHFGGWSCLLLPPPMPPSQSALGLQPMGD